LVAGGGETRGNNDTRRPGASLSEKRHKLLDAAPVGVPKRFAHEIPFDARLISIARNRNCPFDFSSSRARYVSFAARDSFVLVFFGFFWFFFCFFVGFFFLRSSVEKRGTSLIIFSSDSYLFSSPPIACFFFLSFSPFFFSLCFFFLFNYRIKRKSFRPFVSEIGEITVYRLQRRKCVE